MPALARWADATVGQPIGSEIQGWENELLESTVNGRAIQYSQPYSLL
jgi:hypothetical protein